MPGSPSAPTPTPPAKSRSKPLKRWEISWTRSCKSRSNEKNGWNFLPGGIQLFPFISACGVSERQWRSCANRPSRQARPRCGSTTISRVFSGKIKPPQTTVLRGFCGAAIQIRTGDLILTNTLRCVQAVLSGTVWAFFVPIWVVYNGIPPTVSTQFFRVWVRVWVKSQNSKQRHGHKDIEPPSKFAPQNKEKLFFALKTQSKPESPPRPRWTA